MTWGLNSLDLGTDHQKTYRGGEVQKKFSRKGKLNENNSCRAIKPKKKKLMPCPKKNSYKEFDNEKKFLRLGYVSCFCCPAIT